MSLKRRISLAPGLLMILQGTGSAAPYAVRLNSRQLIRALVALGLTLFFAIVGTLLFFRELEINRKLMDRALRAEVREELTEALSPTRSVSLAVAAPTRAPTQIASTADDTDDGKTNAAHAAVPSPTVAAKVGELTADCDGDTCEADVAIVPTASGVAKGQILIILEAEIPRIGAANPDGQIRKRYFLYPSGQSRDDLDQASLSQLPAKAFRFTRALHTHADFDMGKLLRPLAVNVYLFDSEKNVVAHERKAIDTEE